MRALILAGWLRFLAGCMPYMANWSCVEAWRASYMRRGRWWL